MFKDGREAKVFYPTEGFSSEVSGRSFHNGEHPAMMLVMALCFQL